MGRIDERGGTGKHDGHMVRVEIPRNLARDIDRIAKFKGIRKSALIANILRHGLGPYVVEIDQSRRQGYWNSQYRCGA